MYANHPRSKDPCVKWSLKQKLYEFEPYRLTSLEDGVWDSDDHRVQFAIQRFDHGIEGRGSRGITVTDLVSHPIPYVRIEVPSGCKPLTVIIRLDKEQMERAVCREEPQTCRS